MRGQHGKVRKSENQKAHGKVEKKAERESERRDDLKTFQSRKGIAHKPDNMKSEQRKHH